ncbi:MAG TPA: hypothetical protein VHA35_22095 [Dongiaceae bacterium]|jgi:hypothetical protein|nr:hypothetical protein [Dongiaceae bacterium]
MRRLLWALAFTAAASAAAADSKPWDRAEQNGAIYAGTIDDWKQSIEIYCPVTGNAMLVVQSPQFRVSMPNDHRYTLTFVTAAGRTDLVAVSKDAELHYEAADLNAKIALQRLVEDIGNSQTITVAVFPFGWKSTFTAEGAADALKGLLDRCS